MEPAIRTFEEGSDITLTCIIENPQPNTGYIYRWSKEGESLPATSVQRDGKLLLGQATLAMNGVYVVTAGDGSNEVKVEVPVRINRRASEFIKIVLLEQFFFCQS